METLNLSILVVTYNCQPFLNKFLDELTGSLTGYRDYEIRVVDNASTDKTVSLLQSYPAVNVFASPVNLGFAKANNLLLKQATFENILLLNPDVFGFEKPFWQKLYQYWDGRNPLFIRLLNADQTFQDCVGDVVSLSRIQKSLLGKVDYSMQKTPMQVGMGIMAFMLINKKILQKVGKLSEQFHMYSEDMDWCFRATKKGYKNIFDPRLSLVHTGGGSSASRWKQAEVLVEKYNSEKIFINLHYKGLYKQLMRLIVDLKIAKAKWTK